LSAELGLPAGLVLSAAFVPSAEPVSLVVSVALDEPVALTAPLGVTPVSIGRPVPDADASPLGAGIPARSPRPSPADVDAEATLAGLPPGVPEIASVCADGRLAELEADVRSNAVVAETSEPGPTRMAAPLAALARAVAAPVLAVTSEANPAPAVLVTARRLSVEPASPVKSPGFTAPGPLASEALACLEWR
jgi:hypothetical protein